MTRCGGGWEWRVDWGNYIEMSNRCESLNRYLIDILIPRAGKSMADKRKKTIESQHCTELVEDCTLKLNIGPNTICKCQRYTFYIAFYLSLLFSLSISLFLSFSVTIAYLSLSLSLCACLT